MKKIDELIRDGRDTDALRTMARMQYDNGKIGHTRMLLMVRVSDELDEAKREMALSRSKVQKQSIRDYLLDIVNDEIIPGKKYSHRIEIDDGGINSYIGLDVEAEDWKHRPCSTTRGICIFRHTNSVNKLTNDWRFSLGNICHPYSDEPDVPLEFASHGKSPDEAEVEAAQYFDELKKLIRKQTSNYKIRSAASDEEERERLLARLAELDAR